MSRRREVPARTPGDRHPTASTTAAATATHPLTATTADRRFDRVDALRGAAVVWMAGFHFCFDLDHFGLVRQDFHTDPWWTVQRACIVSLFLFCAGLGQALALRRQPAWPPWRSPFWRRWAQIAACAVAVSAGSWWMFPHSFIHFGVLHAIALMLLLVRAGAVLTARRRPPAAACWLVGAAALALPSLLQALVPPAQWPPLLDTRWLNGLGLISHKPVTEDYVPLLPWLGVVLWGVAAGRWALTRQPGWIGGQLPPPLRPLALLGRWSLSFYMLHQPLLIGLLAAVVWLRR